MRESWKKKGFWDQSRGSRADDGKPTFFLKRLVHLFGCRIDLHKFVGADAPNCFHTHPAYAIRIILWGGYTEEVYENGIGGKLAHWFPGNIGLVKPPFAHRVGSIHNGKSSWSLWLRGPICAPVKLVGTGWRGDESTQSQDTLAWMKKKGLTK